MSAVLGPQDHADQHDSHDHHPTGWRRYSQLTIKTLARCIYGLILVCYFLAGYLH